MIKTPVESKKLRVGLNRTIAHKGEDPHLDVKKGGKGFKGYRETSRDTRKENVSGRA